METWSIEPYDDRYVTDNGNGNYVFNPANFPEGQTEITFTITYTDGDISGSMEYVVKSTDCYVNPCSTKLTPPTVSPPKVEDFSSDGGDINAEWDDDTCWELITATTTNNATAATLTNPSIISVAANTSPTEVTSVVTYKFKNTVANVTGQSKVTITQKTNPCYTSETPPTVTFDNGYSATTVAAMGTDASRTAAVLIGTDECWRLESYQFISPTPDEHATFNNDGSSILVNTNQTDAEITIMAKYHFVNVVNSSITGDREIKISQPAGCGCRDLTASPTSLTWDNGDSTPKDITIESASCITNLLIPSVSNNEHYTITTTTKKISVKPVNASVASNDTFSITYLTDCEIPITLKQNERIYRCGDFTFSYLPPSNMRIPTNAQLGNLDLLHITGPSYSSITANCRIEISGYMEFKEFERNGETAIVVVRLMSADTPSVDTVLVKIGNNDICKKYEIFRVCPCGNDDCESNLGDYIIDNELVADSWYLGRNGETEFEYEGHSYPYRFLTSDSIFCDYRKVQVVNGQTTENSKYLSSSTYIIDGGGENLFHIGGWYQDVGDVRVGFDPNRGEHGMITYTMLKNNFTTNRKDHKIIFGVDAGTVLLPGSPVYSELWSNATVCQEFTVNIRQAPNGGHYERHDGCGENEHGVAYRKLVPLTGFSYPGEDDKRDDIRSTHHNCLPPPFAKCINEEDCNT